MINIWKNRKWVPMLLKEQYEPFDSKDYIYELKFDGNRAVIFASPNEVIIQNRHKQDISYVYPELQKIKSLVTKDTIFDGEIVMFQDGAPSFSKLQERAHLKNKTKIKKESEDNPIIFVCFDMLYDGEDITDLTLMSRKKRLAKIKDNDVFMKTKYVEEKGIDLFKKIKKLHLEGIVAKLKTSKYTINERLDDWIKIKNWQEEVFTIGGYIESEKVNMVSLLLGELKNNELHFVGKVTMHKRQGLYKKLVRQKKLKESPFIDFKEDAIYVTPKYKCNVEFLEKTKSNHLRHPVFKEEI